MPQRYFGTGFPETEPIYLKRVCRYFISIQQTALLWS